MLSRCPEVRLRDCHGKQRREGDQREARPNSNLNSCPVLVLRLSLSCRARIYTPLLVVVPCRPLQQLGSFFPDPASCSQSAPYRRLALFLLHCTGVGPPASRYPWQHHNAGVRYSEATWRRRRSRGTGTHPAKERDAPALGADTHHYADATSGASCVLSHLSLRQ